MTEIETKDGGIQKNRYDGEGLRAELEENGELTRFLFSGRDVVAEEKEEHAVIRYIRGLELLSSDCESARTYYLYACDELGSVTHVTDASGEVLNRYTYDAFGNRTSAEETVENRFGFTGELLDGLTGQYYLRARFYSPAIGRFLQEDTYYGDGLNLYSYCQNNPVKYVDPSGHNGCPKEGLMERKEGQNRPEPDAGNANTGKNPEGGSGVNTRTRLPRKNGHWSGEAGNSLWYSDIDAVNGITGGKGIPFINGRPDFSQWSAGELTFKNGVLDGSRSDFNKVYAKLRLESGGALTSNNAARQFLSDNGLTPHHYSSTVIQFIPTDLHGNIPHIGSASDMRGGF